MEIILAQEGGLEVLGTGFVIIKVKSEGLVILSVLRISDFVVVERKYIRV